MNGKCNKQHRSLQTCVLTQMKEMRFSNGPDYSKCLPEFRSYISAWNLNNHLPGNRPKCIIHSSSIICRRTAAETRGIFGLDVSENALDTREKSDDESGRMGSFSSPPLRVRGDFRVDFSLVSAVFRTGRNQHPTTNSGRTLPDLSGTTTGSSARGRSRGWR